MVSPYPRAGGEHRTVVRGLQGMAGSSPRGRGTLLSQRVDKQHFSHCYGGSGPVRVDVPRASIDDEAVVLAGGAEEGTREDVALGVAELMGGGRRRGLVPATPWAGDQCRRGWERTSANEALQYRDGDVAGPLPRTLSGGFGSRPGHAAGARGLGLEGFLGAVGEAGGDGARGIGATRAMRCSARWTSLSSSSSMAKPQSAIVAGIGRFDMAVLEP